MSKKILLSIASLSIAALITATAPAHALTLEKPCVPGNPREAAPWLAESSAEVQKEYITKQWFWDWMETTTTLCTDLRRLETDNAGYKEDNPTWHIIWRNDREVLFRGGSGRTPEEIFTDGFYPWNVTAQGSLAFPSGANNQQSALINTGYYPFYTFLYGINAGGQGYIIDAPGGVNQSASDPNTTWDPKNVIVFPGGIRNAFIKGAFTLEENKLVYLPNKNYIGGQPAADEFDLIVSPWFGIARESASQSVIEPQGTQIGHIAQRYKKGTEVTLTLKNAPSSSSITICWYVNDRATNISSDTFKLTATDQQLPVVVVHRSDCPK